MYVFGFHFFGRNHFKKFLIEIISKKKKKLHRDFCSKNWVHITRKQKKKTKKKKKGKNNVKKIKIICV
jgi:hypothetical protein